MKGNILKEAITHALLGEKQDQAAEKTATQYFKGIKHEVYFGDCASKMPAADKAFEKIMFEAFNEAATFNKYGVLVKFWGCSKDFGFILSSDGRGKTVSVTYSEFNDYNVVSARPKRLGVYKIQNGEHEKFFQDAARLIASAKS